MNDMENPAHPHITAFLLFVLLLAAGCGEDSDTALPEVVRTEPKNEATNVSLNTLIEVKFHEQIDPGSIEGTVEISPTISGIVTYDKETRKLIFHPSESFEPNTEYAITLDGIRDKAGNKMEAYTFRFTSGKTDDSPPQVTGTIPMKNEEDVLEDIDFVVIEFSERLDRTKVYNAYNIRGDIGGKIGVRDGRWLDTVSYQVELDSQPENGETVTVKVDKNYVIDLSGNKMKEDYAFAFTIEGIIPVGRPRNYSYRRLAYSIWQGTSGEWRIRWTANLIQGAPPREPFMDDSPSQPKPEPKPKPKPKPRPYSPDQHYFSGTIVSDGAVTAALDPNSFSDGDLIRMEVEGNLVEVTGDQVIVERDEANTVILTADEITIDGHIGDMVTVEDKTVTVTGDIVAIIDNIVAIEGNILTVKGDSITVRGNGGSIIVAEGSVLNVKGNVVIIEGELTSLTGSAVVIEGDVVVIQGNSIWFAGYTGESDSGDGFDFKSDGVYLTFDIKIDNEYMKNNVFIGEKGKSPREIPFELKSRYPYEGL